MFTCNLSLKLGVISTKIRIKFKSTLINKACWELCNIMGLAGLLLKVSSGNAFVRGEPQQIKNHCTKDFILRLPHAMAARIKLNGGDEELGILGFIRSHS